MEAAGILIASIGGLITAVTTAFVALVKARRNGDELAAVRTQVTPSNGMPLAALTEETLELLRATSRRVDLHDTILTRIAERLDRDAQKPPHGDEPLTS